jgi:60 kDa SS-A/Ro ribonucleoprotein
MKTNVPVKTAAVFTHEGAPARNISHEQMLRRSVMACLLWEKTFYEDGVEIADRIAELVPKVKPEVVAALAMEAREEMKLRHAPLLLVREMARYPTHRALVGATLERVIQRVDEIAEFLAIYSAGRTEAKKLNKLAHQVRKGLAASFGKFSEYQFAKYDRDGAVKLRDALFLCHPKPRDAEQEALFKKIVDGTLATPDTWEVALSGGADKKETWNRLIAEKKLGGLALLRNLRNMHQAGVGRALVREAVAEMKIERILPYRFIAAARAVPQWENLLEQPMLRCMEGQEKLRGHTVLLVDVSGSMDSPLSAKSDLRRLDAACGLAILLREIAEDLEVKTFSSYTKTVPARRGFALRDAIVHSQPHNATYLGKAVESVRRADRLVVITDEQSHDRVPAPKCKGYMINVAAYRNGVGYGEWTHVDGFSESVLHYICEFERLSGPA